MDPIADDLLEQWRHNCRDWLARLFAFAVPNAAALNELAALSPIVEIGAGTGYWASLLRSKGVDVVAYDSAPPSSEESASASFSGRRKSKKQKAAAMNEYHGASAQFTEVLRGGADVLGSASDAAQTLFLCYPPPAEAMAFDCLSAFQGTRVVYVGEWHGLTADARFERLLASRFALSKRVALPNFANQACEMTIWERYAAPLHKAGHHPHQSPSAPALAHGENAASRVAAAEDELVRCAACARTMTDCALGKQRSLRRCMYCREVLYCSAKCVRAHAKTHQALHALRHVFLKARPIKWPQDFR